jgi:hypothetical protein
LIMRSLLLKSEDSDRTCRGTIRDGSTSSWNRDSCRTPGSRSRQG